jgi:hypothetical protein
MPHQRSIKNKTKIFSHYNYINMPFKAQEMEFNTEQGNSHVYGRESGLVKSLVHLFCRLTKGVESEHGWDAKSETRGSRG